jgi:membrane-associated protease RseP (regulator of RpoE activity)
MSEDTEPKEEERAEPREEPAESELSRWRLPLVLLALTFMSTLFVGAQMVSEGLVVDSFGALVMHYATHPLELLAGWTYAVPLMSILFAHEMGHYIAAKIHRVDASPPFFIPLPIALGTLGAVIRMRGAIKTKNALLDVGAAGPIAGLVVALPVLIWGLHTSPVRALPEDVSNTYVEGRGLLYLGVLYLLKGPIPATHDVWLNPTAMAGWAGLLVTQINLIPVAQLDGGHVAYALFGEKQNRYSRIVHRLLPVVGVTVSLAYLVPAWLRGERDDALMGDALAGVHWVMWAVLLLVMTRLSGADHPPTGPEPLSRNRRIVAAATLLLFGLLFMPSWFYLAS